MVLQNYGPWFDIQGAGIYSVILGDLKNAKEDLSSAEWTYQVLAVLLQNKIATRFIIELNVVDCLFTQNVGTVQNIA